MSENYDCSKCPAYCCSVYGRVRVTQRDLKRLAKHFKVNEATARRRYTKMYDGERTLRQKKDSIFSESCSFLNPLTRQCTIYEARPQVCREFPDAKCCAYYDLLQFERQRQGDETAIPLVQIAFRDEIEAARRKRAGKR